VDVAIEKTQTSQTNPTLTAQYLSPQLLSITLPNTPRFSAATASIYTIAGKKLSASGIATAAGQVRMRTPVLPVGVYFVGVEAAGVRQFAKFVVIR
jgi:hypothetical protein